jgi:hypothetical protein
MPELPLFVFIGALVVAALLLLRREHHLLDEDDEPQRLDVQNHEGDE